MSVYVQNLTAWLANKGHDQLQKKKKLEYRMCFYAMRHIGLMVQVISTIEREMVEVGKT